MQPTIYQHPEVIPQAIVRDWKRSVSVQIDCPKEVAEFIDAMDKKMGDFKAYGRETVMIKGSDLLACGHTTWQGDQIFSFAQYTMQVPKMQAVDHKSTMLRLYKKKGKQGLIDYCRTHVKGTELERLLQVLNVHVFHQHRPEFTKLMDDIEQSKKIYGI